MKRHTYSTSVIEWVECPPRFFYPGDPRVLKNVTGRFVRLRKWLFQKLSTPEVRQPWKLKQATYNYDNIVQLVRGALHKQRLRSEDIQLIIVSTKVAFDLENLLFERSMNICQGSIDGKMYIFGIPITVLPTYEGRKILFVPKDR